MSVKGLGALTVGLVGLALATGAAQAGTGASTTVLKFFNPPGQTTGIGGFNLTSNTPPPLGSSLVIRVRLENIGSQFGKPSGATVGRVLLQCTVLTDYAVTGTVDGICNGIAHVPNGFITFVGNGTFSNAQVNYYAVTGGVGPYANDRGQIRVVNNKDGSSNATVTLTR